MFYVRCPSLVSSEAVVKYVRAGRFSVLCFERCATVSHAVFLFPLTWFTFRTLETTFGFRAIHPRVISSSQVQP